MDIMSDVKQALKYTEEKKYKKAEEIYLNLLKQDENNAVILSFLGLLYLNAGMYKKAEKYLEKSAGIKINNATTEGLGFVKYYLNKYEEALKYLSIAIENNKSFDIYDKYVKTLIKLRLYKKSYEYAYECYQKYPLKKEALDNLAMSCIYIGRLKDCLKYSEQMVNKYPKYGIGWSIYGLINEILYHNDEFSKHCYEMALKYGEKRDAYYNLAVSANKLRDYKKAEYYIKKAFEYNPDKDSLNFVYSTILFQQRKFKQGFKYYARKDINANPQKTISKLKRPWDGKTYRGETLFTYSDQGIGDCIMFSRFLPQLEKKFKKIKVYADKSVIKLLKRSFKQYPKLEFTDDKKRFPRYDKSLILSNIPYYLKTKIDEIPFKGRYMVADDKICAEYRKKYFEKIDKLKVGICWEAGGVGWREQLNRTLNITLFEPLFKLENVQFYSFQVNPSMDNYKKYDNLINLGTTFKNYDDTAGALMNLDVLVTVDTSVAHLAGALGVKTFMLLPYCPDWRWFDNTEKTEWYDSVKIFKQSDNLSWDNVFERIKNELSELK